MSLLVFYHAHAVAGPRTHFVKGEGSLFKYRNGETLVSLVVNGENHHRQIYTPIAVLDDTSSPPRLILEQGNGERGEGFKWYRGMKEMPELFIDLNGDIRSKHGEIVMQGNQTP